MQKVRGIEKSGSGLAPKSLLIILRGTPPLAKRLDASVRQLLVFVVFKVLRPAAVRIEELVERVTKVDVAVGDELDVGPRFSRRRSQLDERCMEVAPKVYQKLSALHAQDRSWLIYTGGEIYRAQEIEKLAPLDPAVAAVKVRCENGEIQHILLDEIEAVVERGGRVA